MNGRTWRLPVVVAVLVGVAVAGTVLALAEVASSTAQPESQNMPERVRSAVLGWGALLVIFWAAAGAWAGSRLTASLAQVRRALLERAPPDVFQVVAPSRLHEARQLIHAAERLSTHLNRQADGIERQRRELALLVDSVSEGLLFIDERGRLAYLNPAASALLNLPPGALAQPFAVLVRDAELRSVAERALAGDQVSGSEIAVGDRHLLVSAQPVQDNHSGRGAVIAIADHTALRRLEGVRRDFVANVSHELKTPLTSIRGYVETVLNEDLDAEVRRQFLEVVQKNAERLQWIVDELLDLSSIESGGWKPEPQELNAAAHVREAWVACDIRAREKHIDFRAPTDQLWVCADPRGLRQVLGNLFDNALRHTPDHGLVEVRLHRTGAGANGADENRGWIVFEVHDNGNGIPREALPRIFERFFRVDPARSRAAGGTGLGLAIVKHLIEAMGGDVAAESELGRGTTIRFRLPAAR